MAKFSHKLLLQSAWIIAVWLGCFSAAEGVDCRKWKKKSFLKKVTVDELTQCLELGYSPVSNDKHGSTPLHWASAYTFDPMVIDGLIDVGADVNARFHDSVWGSRLVGNITPLHLAAGYNINPMVVKRLIARRPDVESRDNLGRTPLHWASGGSMDPYPSKLTSEDRSSLVVQALIDAGANVMARDNSGRTPLHWAADFVPQRQVLKVLVEAGSNLAARTKKGALPVTLAKRSHKKYLRDAWQALTPQQKEAARRVGDVYGYYAKRERKKSQNSPGILDAVIAVGGGTAIAAAGGGTDEAMKAGTVFAESVIAGRPSGESIASAPAAAPASNTGSRSTAGPCLIPNFPNHDPKSVTDIEIPWCPSGGPQVETFTGMAVVYQCSLSMLEDPEKIREVRRRIAEYCKRLDAMKQLGGDWHCQCPPGFGQ